jgi:hypothetical protein
MLFVYLICFIKNVVRNIKLLVYRVAHLFYHGSILGFLSLIEILVEVLGYCG